MLRVALCHSYLPRDNISHISAKHHPLSVGTPPTQPTCIPILGMLTLPPNWCHDLKRRADKYPDILTIRMTSIALSVVNSRRAAFEIMEKRAWINKPLTKNGDGARADFSIRIGQAQDSSQTAVPKLHKECRWMLSVALSPRVVQAYGDEQAHQFHRVALDMLSGSGKYRSAIVRSVLDRARAYMKLRARLLS
ncbi:hypothetical protein DACRYDRAFT_24056 [Dacryopinax primogenitus]|uniref:Uncharacterized protein n=1 Tax=Dacryopinax primogenitus (strain DJM 731) TaxID=1858805 RepID=M5FZF0_DACPD|nr:uncharacterized protein DACRYDRAFT_24056 [Dacryopinax primogenitus]EJT98946.1 hypothetical protein DACRYDRAFT_24056 [Dacryopinax primogenitus]